MASPYAVIAVAALVCIFIPLQALAFFVPARAVVSGAPRSSSAWTTPINSHVSSTCRGSSSSFSTRLMALPPFKGEKPPLWYKNKEERERLEEEEIRLQEVLRRQICEVPDRVSKEERQQNTQRFRATITEIEKLQKRMKEMRWDEYEEQDQLEIKARLEKQLEASEDGSGESKEGAAEEEKATAGGD